MFGKKKQKKQETMPVYSDVVLIAYVDRLQPKTWRGHSIGGKLPNSKAYDGITEQHELERQIAVDNGGGEYRCQLHESGNTKNYMYLYTFTIGGDPLNDGKPYEREEQESTKKGSKDDPIAEIEKETAVEKASIERDKMVAARKKMREEQGLETSSNDDDDEKTSVAEELREEMREIREEAAERDRQRDEQKREDRYDRLMETVLTAVTGKSNDSGSKEMFAAQMEAMKTMVMASQESTKAILTAQDSNRKETQSTISKMMEMMNTRGDSLLQMIMKQISEAGDFKLKATEALAEAKSQNASETLALMRKTFETAMQLGMGKSPDEEDRPSNAIDLVDRISERLSTVVGNYFQLKGQQTPLDLDKKIREVAKAAADEALEGGVMALPAPDSSETPQPQAGLAGSVMPDQAPTHGTAAAATHHSRAKSPEGRPKVKAEPINPRARNAMNGVLQEFIKAADEGKGFDGWMNKMLTQLPNYVVEELLKAKEGTVQEFVDVLHKYGDQNLVDEAMKKLAKHHEQETSAKHHQQETSAEAPSVPEADVDLVVSQLESERKEEAVVPGQPKPAVEKLEKKIPLSEVKKTKAKPPVARTPAPKPPKPDKKTGSAPKK